MIGSSRLFRLLEPINIKGMTVRNRFVMTPMLGGSDSEGFATDQMVKWYEESARGGVGMIILGAHCIDSGNGRMTQMQGIIDDDKYIPSLAEVA